MRATAPDRYIIHVAGTQSVKRGISAWAALISQMGKPDREISCGDFGASSNRMVLTAAATALFLLPRRDPQDHTTEVVMLTSSRYLYEGIMENYETWFENGGYTKPSPEGTEVSHWSLWQALHFHETIRETEWRCIPRNSTPEIIRTHALAKAESNRLWQAWQV